MSDGRVAHPTLPDLVYVIGPDSSGHEELRYSLRSVAKNLPHRKVWIVGSVPAFTTNVEGLSLTPHPEKFGNQRQSLTAAVNHPDISEEIIVLSDDHFILQPVTGHLPCIHVGPTDQYISMLEGLGKDNPWVTAVKVTGQWAGNPKCYETHTPLRFSTERLRAVLSAYPNDLPLAYPQHYEAAGAGLEGVLGADVKVSRDSAEPDPDAPFLSSVDWSFDLGPAGRIVRNLFPQKCRYEA